MYGFLRPHSCALPQEERREYHRYYCGQCGAIQRHYGYPWRALVSYDAAFLGLLLSAQLDDAPEEGKAWCAVFPRKTKTYAIDALPQIFSSSIAVLLASMKLEDSKQEKETRIKSLISGFCKKGFSAATEELTAMNFSLQLVEQTLEDQQQIENFPNQEMEQYAEPSARFLGEIFRFTARTANQPQNEDTLYDIGYHTGRLIYLADSCIDLTDDMERKQFNALLAAYRDDQTLISEQAQIEITRIANQSIQKIRELLLHLKLKRHNALIQNILFSGLPAVMANRLRFSMKKMKNIPQFALKYLPHTALAVVACLMMAETVEAGWVWGETVNFTWKGYGYSCFNPPYKEYSDCCFCGVCECICNPCVCYYTHAGGPIATVLTFICQVPKALVSGAVPFSAAISAASRWKKQIEESRLDQQKQARQHEEQRIHEFANRNSAFLSKSIHGINVIKSDLMIHDISVDHRKQIIAYTEKHPDEEWSESSELQRLIDQALEQAQQDKQRLDEALAHMAQALHIYSSVKSSVDRSGNIPLQKELAWDCDQLQSKKLKHLLAATRWEEYEKAVQYIIDDMDKLKNQPQKVQPQNKDIYKQTVSTLDHVPTKRLLLLLNACTDQHLIIIDMILKDIVQTEAYQFGLQMDEYEYLTDGAKKNRKAINTKDFDNIQNAISRGKLSEANELPYGNMKELYQYAISGGKLPLTLKSNQLTLGGIMELYRKLREMQEMADRSEKTLTKGKTDDIDIIHRDWRNYLTKLQGG